LHNAARRSIEFAKKIQKIFYVAGLKTAETGQKGCIRTKMSKNGAYLSTKIVHKPYLGEFQPIQS